MRLPWLSWSTLAIGVVASVVAGLWTQRAVEQEARSGIAEAARDYAEQVEERLRAYSEVVYTVRALFEHSDDVTRSEFRRFAQGLAIAHRYPGITNISYAVRVRNEQRTAFEQRMRAEAGAGLPPFAISPAGERSEYVVLSHIEPLKDNAVALGLDLATDPARNSAVQRARDTGLLSMTSGMTLLRDANNHAMSVLLRLAVYEGGGVPPTIEARRSSFAGVAGVAIRLPEMMGYALTTEVRGHIRLRLEDTTGATADGKAAGTLLFDSLAVEGASPAVAFAQYATTHTFDVGDRVWAVLITPLSDPMLKHDEWLLPYAASAAVMVISLLFFGLLRSLGTAERQGTSLRRSLRTLEFHRARLAETQAMANIGGFEWDTRQDHQVWSDQLYRIVGRAVGDPPEPDRDFIIGSVVHPVDIPLVRDAFRQVLEAHAPVRLQCRIVRPDGAERIVTIVTQLDAADDGARTRVVGTVRDVTDEWGAAERERAQLKFIQTMMDAIPIPVYQKDTAGRLQACNDALCSFVGKPRDMLIGRTLDEFLPGPHVAAISEQDRKLLEHAATVSIEADMPDARGELRQMLLHKASYTGEDGAMAGLVGVAFDITDANETKARLEQTIAELDRRNRLAELLGEFGEVLQACLGLEDAYEAIAKYLPRLLPGSGGVLYRVDTGRGSAERRAGWGDPEGTGDTLTPSDCVAVRRGQPRCVADAAQELNCRHFTTPPPSYACLPLSSHGELLGLLHVQRALADHAGGCDPKTGWPALRSAADHISLALANLAIRETLREQATRDKLTGLYNRHYLDARFEQELARARRNHGSMAVILLDIDQFKRFNDTFGHAAGDHVLRELGKVLLHAGRQSDVACRYGGEEFVLFMPDASCEVARVRAEELRRTVKTLQLETDGLPLGSVTVSAGVAVYPEDGGDPDALLRAADQALYRAKELGRDRVVLAHSTAAVTEH